MDYPELVFTSIVKKGDKGSDVKLTQEWLSYHGYPTAIDSDFGPATERCVKRFQAKSGIAESGVVNTPTQSALLAPIRAAVAEIPVGSKTLGALVVAYARQHLKQHPIEIGGENAGPWVRLYMDGNEGPPWPWCAGFVTFVLRQAEMFANRVKKEAGDDPASQIDLAYRIALTRSPTPTERSVALKTPLPVYLVYFTAWEENGTAKFADDVYGYDRRQGARN